MLPTNDITAGDVLIGLRSSGVHSNGYSLVRKIVELSGLNWNSPAPFEDGVTLGEALLRPTRIYVRQVLAALKAGHKIKALAHITGGGFTENIPRVLPENLAANIDRSTIEAPAVFGWLANTGGVETSEMMRTFNCGVGMVLVASKDEADNLVEALKNEGEEPIILGDLVERDGDAVLYHGELAL